MDLGDYLRIFRERWLAIVVCLGLGLGLATAVTLATTPTYKAGAVLFLKVNSDNGSFYDRSQFSVQRVKSYPDLVDSPQVLRPVIAELDLDATPQQLAQRVSATNPVDTVALKVTAQSADAAESARIANSVSVHLSETIDRLESVRGEATSSIELVLTVPALTPSAPASPNQTINLALGAIGGVAAGLILAILRSLGDRRIRTARDVRRAGGLPLLAQLPTGDRGWRRPFALGSAEDDEAAAQEVLTNLQLIENGRLPACVVLVPATRRPRTNRIRLRLARAFAAGGRAVCLVDADAGVAPRASRALAEDSPGLAEVLDGTATLDDVVVRPPDLTFAVLPGGALGAASARHEVRRALGPVIDELGAKFDLCIIQSTPRSHPVEVSMLAPVTDAVVIVAEFGRTRVDDLRRLVAQLEADRIRPAGVLLASVPSWRRQLVVDGWTDGDFADGDFADGDFADGDFAVAVPPATPVAIPAHVRRARSAIPRRSSMPPGGPATVPGRR